MGKKAKVGKARKDKFYHLAKETGYRSRAAFKLIQLNRKYEFLQKSNIIVDLCAAPGGWLQVAVEHAPMSHLIVGIDLVPIPPVGDAKTLQEDITTEKCRQSLKKELHTAKADCFLNDGAPNVGKSWVHDAYQQAELTLHAMRLATEFLRRGGWFITKLFRSKDYDALMWVFQQLFKNVHATKPQASRNESAEIFVVCQGYLAPDRIDPKFLDPRHVFSEVTQTQKPSIDLIHPEKKKRQREGYPEGDYTLFHSLPVSEFFASDNFMELLAQASEIAFDDEIIQKHPLTTPEIKECIKDIKVLGKKDIKAVFLWRKKLKKELEKKKESQSQVQEKRDDQEDKLDTDEEENLMDEADMEELETILEQKNKEELAALKKAKKKVRDAQRKQKMRIDLKMTIPGDQPDIQDDINMFDIRKIRSKMQLAEVEKGDLSHLDKDDIFEDSEDEKKPKRKKTEYFDRDEKKYVGVEGGESEEEEEEMEEEPMFEEESEEEESKEEAETAVEDNANPLIIDLDQTKRVKQDKQSAWFRKAAFAGLDSDGDEDLELEQMVATTTENSKGKKKKDEERNKSEKNTSAAEKSRLLKSIHSEDVGGFDSDGDSDSGDSGGENDEDDDSDYDFTEMMYSSKKQLNKGDNSKSKKSTVGGIEVVPAVSTDSNMALDAEGLALGAAMVQSQKRKREIIDAGFHRYLFDDDNLPDWFITDERKHMKRRRLVTKEEVEEYNMKMKAIDAQPIKKIAEAKARKKKKSMKKLEKARKKANAVSDSVDTSEKEKWQQIKQIYKKAGLLNKTKPSVTYVVAKKGAGKKVRRPAGVKGQFKVVDGRMKKDLRGQKKAEARAKGKKGSTKSGRKGQKGGRVRR